VPEVIVEKQYGKARRAIEKGLEAYNQSRVGKVRSQKFAVTLREGETILGGASAVVWRNWCFVELLWIDESQRGTGLGTKLMDQTEAEARRRGAKHIYLDTFSFQARPFYEKRGYSVFGELSDFPPGESRFWLSKSL
jgi:GNAT superfamily N-acetyltransferase